MVGGPARGSWGNASDKRLKKNIRPLTGGLDKLMELRGVSYEYIEPEKSTNYQANGLG